MQVRFRMPIGNAELRYDCSLEHLCRLNRFKMEINKAGTKERSPDGQTVYLAYQSLRRESLLQKRWMNYLTDLTYPNKLLRGDIRQMHQWGGELRQGTRRVGFTSSQQLRRFDICHRHHRLGYTSKSQSFLEKCDAVKNSFSWAIYNTEKYPFNLLHSLE